MDATQHNQQANVFAAAIGARIASSIDILA